MDFDDMADTTFGDWQRDYLFKVLILSEPTAPEYQSLKGDFDKDTLDLFVESFPLPGSKTGTIRKRRSGIWGMFPSKQESNNSFQVTFNYDEHNRFYRFVHACDRLVNNKNGSVGHASGAAVPKSQYVFNLGLALYKTDKETVGQGYKLVNTWVAALDDLPLDKSKDGILSFSVTFAYDRKETL